MTTTKNEVWVIEYSDRQRQFHIQRAAYVDDAGPDWRRIGEVTGTIHDANAFCDEWKRNNSRQP